MKRLAVTLFAVASLSAFSEAQYAVIANPSVDEYTIDRAQLVQIYSLGTTTWKDGSPVVAFDLKEEGKTRAAFYDYISRTPLEMRRLWMKAMLSGEKKAPEAVATEEEIAEKVASTPGSIGYVSAAKIGKKVKVLLRFGK